MENPDVGAAAISRVYVDMVGDLFHAGHVSLLREARRHGDWLVVGVLADDTAASYKRRPIMTLAERVAVIESCRYVDEVIEDAPLQVTEEFLAEHGITTVVHGDDLSPEGAEFVYGPAAAAGKLTYVRRTGGISTTQLIQRVLDAAASRNERPDLMGFVGSVLGAGSAKVAAGGSALTGSDPLVEVWRQTVRPLVVRRRTTAGMTCPLHLGEHWSMRSSAVSSALPAWWLEKGNAMLFVGDDWAEDHHDIEIVNEEGRRLARRRLPEGLDGVTRLHALIASVMPEQWADLPAGEAAARVKVGIETERGPWVTSLVAAGYEVFAINPMSTARYRERHSTSKAKSDPGDAHVLAEIVRLDRGHHRPIAGDSDDGEAMKLVARSHQSMIWDRTRHVLRLRSALREYFPAALNAFDDLDAPDALAVLAAAPDPDRAARLSTARISTALRKANRRDVPAKAREIQAILRAPALRQPPAVQQAFAAIVAGAGPPDRGTQRRDRRPRRGGGRTFWPPPGR